MLPRALAFAGLLALGLPAAAHASKGPSFTVRDGLTARTELRGTVNFAQPSGWKRTAGGGSHSYATFRVAEGACRLDLTTSVRGKATSQSVAAQISGAVGDAPFGSGSRPGGAWGTDGPKIPAGEGFPLGAGLYGIAPIRVAARRYGQLGIQGLVRGCNGDSADAQTLLDPKGATVRQLNHVLKTAKASLRVTRDE